MADTERCPSGAQCFPFGCSGHMGCDCFCHALAHESSAEYSLNYVWERNRVIVHVDRDLSPQSALNLADSLRYFAERHRCDGERDWCDACEAREVAVVTPSRTDKQPPDPVVGAKGGYVTNGEPHA